MWGMRGSWAKSSTGPRDATVARHKSFRKRLPVTCIIIMCALALVAMRTVCRMEAGSGIHRPTTPSGWEKKRMRMTTHAHDRACA